MQNVTVVDVQEDMLLTTLALFVLSIRTPKASSASEAMPYTMRRIFQLLYFKRGLRHPLPLLTFSIEFVYKEVTGESTVAQGKVKKKSATEAQKTQRAAEAGLWSRVYEHCRCKGKHCKQGSHCWLRIKLQQISPLN